MERISSYIKQTLKDAYSPEEVRSFVMLLWCDVLGRNSLDIYLEKDTDLSASEKEQLDDILQRLLRFEPIQYILGEANFCGHKFQVAPGVLIPRPETQELVELIVSENQLETPAILDIGTGSGCISISLSLAIPNANVTAWDISEDALRQASINNKQLDARVTFEQCNVLDELQINDSSYDIIVSNPPYITVNEKADMERNVLEWEPGLALFVSNEDPLLFYRTIAQHALQLLKPKGKLYFEINRVYGQDTISMLSKLGYTDCKILKDFYGNDRFAIAHR